MWSRAPTTASTGIVSRAGRSPPNRGRVSRRGRKWRCTLITQSGIAARSAPSSQHRVRQPPRPEEQQRDGEQDVLAALAPDPTRAEQCQRRDPVGLPRRVVEREPAAQRFPDQGHPVQAEPVEHRAQPRGAVPASPGAAGAAR